MKRLMSLALAFGLLGFPMTVRAQCGNLVDYSGYEYRTVKIGEQCWFAENLQTTTYRNGDTIPHNLSNIEWELATSGAMAFADDDHDLGRAYGGFYNWYALDDSRGLCPNDWHVPSEIDWTMLIDFLGGDNIAGLHMKNKEGWDTTKGGATNLSGFTGLPNGFRSPLGHLIPTFWQGNWWVSSSVNSQVWNRCILESFPNVLRYRAAKNTGLPVRCVRNAE